MEFKGTHAHTNAVAVRLTIGILSLHFIGMSFLVLFPATASAATLANLTAAIDEEYHMVDGARTTLKLQESEYESGWLQYEIALSLAEALERTGVELEEIFDNAIARINDAKAALVPIVVPVSADKTVLTAAITAAQSKHDTAVEGTVPGQYAVGSKASFQTAISAAMVVRDNPVALQTAVDQAVVDLAMATATFDAALVPKIATTTTISSSLNPSVSGQSVTFTAIVSPAAATGSVSFAVGTMPPVTATVSNGSGSVLFNALAVGTHSVIATFGGNNRYEGSASAPLTQTVRAQQSTGGNGSGGGGGGGGGGIGGSSGGHRGAGTFSADPFRPSFIKTAPPAFGGQMPDLSDIRRSQRITICRVQSSISSLVESILERHADRIAQHWGWTAERVLAGFRDESLCE